MDANGAALGCQLDGMEGLVASEMLFFRRPVILGGGSGAVVRREFFQAVGGFDESLTTSADWDLYYRIACSHPVAFVPEVLLRYRIHGSNMSRNVRAMERDMLRGFAKAFAPDNPGVQPLRRLAYGRLHAMLAGSFFQAGDYWSFLRHAARSLVLTPSSGARFAAFPLRKWQKRTRQSARTNAASTVETSA